MAEVGETLREARMRARIDVSEIEAQTKIRAKYLRALENEEWNLVPGPTFVRSFLRTYAQALGLDGKALVDEYRRVYEQPSELDHQPAIATQRRPRRRTAGLEALVPRNGVRLPSRGYAFAVGAFVLVIVLLLIGLASGKKGGTPSTQASTTKAAHRRAHHRSAVQPQQGLGATGGQAVALSLKPSAPVWVCLIGDGNRKDIAGVTLEPSYTPVTYRASRFTLTLGNAEVTMYVNGRAETVPTTSQAIGYAIDASGRHLLPSGRLPTCK